MQGEIEIMTTFRFTKNHDYKIPGKRAYLFYKAGQELTVPQGVITSALEAKAGHVVPTPKRKNDDG